VSGTPAEIVWNQGFFTTPPFAIPKGAKNVENANLFLNFVLQPAQQAAWSNLSYYGYVNTAAEPKVKPDVRARLPTASQNFGEQIQLDNDWWAKHQSEVSERLASFLA
jgi:putative spermidine/putrescine transport system substrate-binding protein